MILIHNESFYKIFNKMAENDGRYSALVVLSNENIENR